MYKKYIVGACVVVSFYWTIEFVNFCRGGKIDNFTIGLALALAVLTFINMALDFAGE